MIDRICILVTGSRGWTDREAIHNRLRVYKPGRASVLLHGAARGADALANEVGNSLGFIVEPTPYFETLGKAGGPSRNALLVDKLCCYGRHGYELFVEAFLLPSSVGTRDCLRRVGLVKIKGAQTGRVHITVHETHQE